MSRAFATLEGIGLSSDPDYAILKECFPYLAKRLLSDDSPRARGALRTLLYGADGELNLDKLKEVAGGFETFTAATTSVASSRGEGDEGRSAAVEQLAAVLLSADGNFVQELLLREAAVALDVGVRDQIASALRRAPPLVRPPPLPAPLAQLTRPLTLPLEVAAAAAELQQPDARDVRRLENLRILADLASGASARPGGGGGGGGGGGDSVASLARAAADNREALARIGVRFGGALAQTQAERLRQRGGGAGDAELSELASTIAAAGAERLEEVASAIGSLDDNLAAGAAAGRDDATPLLPPGGS